MSDKGMRELVEYIDGLDLSCAENIVARLPKRVQDELWILRGLCADSVEQYNVMYREYYAELSAYCRALRDAGVITNGEKKVLADYKND